MNYLLKNVLAIGALVVLLPATTACSEKYLTYNHTPGEKTENPEDPGEVEMPDNMAKGAYKLLADKPGQVIKGLGFEIQSEISAHANVNNENRPLGVPYDLVPSERKRLAEEMLKGFRYMRVGMGIYFRGVTPDHKNMIERKEGQAEAMVQLMKDAGVEGISMEYWSPAPYWKSNGNFIDGTLKSFDDDFLEEFTDALVQDVKYMKDKGFKVSTWGLQNECMYPEVGYAHCHYTEDQFVKVFGKIAPKIRALDSDIEIIYDTNSGQNGSYGPKLWQENPQLLKYVDAWVYHRIGDNSDFVMDRRDSYKANSQDKPIYQNEYEYFSDQVKATTFEWLMVNTAQSIMNWMTFIESPKWYWLHALKPIDDTLNRDGFGLGVWRPSYANESHDYPELAHGHWEFNWQNYNAIAGFLKYMPWDSRRYNVEEDEERHDNRIMAWKTPEGKLVMAMTNRSDDWFEFDVTLDGAKSMKGFRFDKNGRDVEIGSNSGASTVTAKLKPWSIEFWVEQ